MKIRITVLFCTIAFMPVSSVLADSWNVELIGRDPFGPANAIYTVGDHAYLCAGGTLVVLDVTNPEELVELGRTDTPHIANALHVAGDYAYVANGGPGNSGGGICVIDISDPSTPNKVGVCSTPGSARGIYVAGNYAYLAAYDAGLRVMDISDPSSPYEVGFYDTPGFSFGIHVSGGYAYVADGDAGICVIDVSDPSSPNKVVSYDMSWAKDIRISGSYAYAIRWNMLCVIDISDPSNPYEVGFCYVYPNARDVHVIGNYAYVASDYEGLRIINITNPLAPYEVGFYDPSGYASGSSYGVYVLDGYAYVTYSYAGLRVIDISDPSNPYEVGFYNTPGWAYGIDVVGDYAYVADNSDGLRIIDISDPSKPYEVGLCLTAYSNIMVQVSGIHAYVVNEWGIYVINVYDPVSPYIEGFYGLPKSTSRKIHLVGNYIYLITGRYLRVIDISNPTALYEVGFWYSPGYTYGIHVVGSHAYLADRSMDGHVGLRVIDISDPSNPYELGYYVSHVSDYPCKVHVIGEYAYLIDYGDGFRVIDISDILSPYEAGFCDTPGGAYSIHVSGGYAYIVFAYGLRVIEISEPSNPYEVGFYNTPGKALGIYAADGYAYVADGEDGLCILRYTNNQPPDQPTNISPVDGAIGVTLMPELESSLFSDPDTGDIHTASQWQVTEASGNYSAPVFDEVVDSPNLTNIFVPPGRLEVSTTYHWHVRHQDSHDAWSEWSVETSFTTCQAGIQYIEYDPLRPGETSEIKIHVVVAEDGDYWIDVSYIPTYVFWPYEPTATGTFPLVANWEYIFPQTVSITPLGSIYSMTRLRFELIEGWFGVEDSYEQILIADRPPLEEDPLWSKEEVQDLVEQYAPVLKMAHSSKGEYIPQDVKVWMDTGNLTDEDGNVIASRPVVRNQLYQFSGSDHCLDLQCLVGEDHWEDCVNAQHLWLSWKLINQLEDYDTVIYATAVREEIGEGRIAIQYWLPYYCSDWARHGGFNDHEGDWENITIILSSSGEPLWAAYSQHTAATGGGQRRHWNEVVKLELQGGTPTDHPIVYVGLGGHASYFSSGYTNYKKWWIPGSEYITWEDHRGLGDWVIPEDSYDNVDYPQGGDFSGEKLPLKKVVLLPRASSISGANDDCSWIIYSGRWGQKDLPGPKIGNDGIRGPAFAADNRWLDPWGWAWDLPLDTKPGEVTIHALSPVDLLVTDPEGRVASKGLITIPSASYTEVDLDGDGELDDEVVISDAVAGGYSIQVIAESGADPTDTYTLDVSYGDETRTLAEDVEIQYIQSEPYTFFFPQCDMEPGWNLISIPVQLPDNALATVLQSIADNYISVWAYDALTHEWKRFIVGAPDFLNTLETIEAGKGYWIQMTNPSILTLDGSVVADDPIPLELGWNLVGYNYLAALPLADALSSIAGNYVSAWAYDAVNHEWKRFIVGAPDFLNNLEILKPGNGHWIDTTTACTWDISGSISPPAPPVAAGFERDYVSHDKPGIPYTIWGSVKVDGVKMTPKDSAPVVLLKVDNETQSSYRLGETTRYGDFYVLNVPATADSSAQVELYVQMGDTAVKAAPVLPGRQGEVIRHDLFVQITPETSLLHQNYPNPFNPDTWIPYQLSQASDVEVRIYTAAGRLVRMLNLGHKPAGFYADKEKAAYWDGRNEAGEHVASGVYFYSIKAADLTATRKMIMVR